MSSTVAVIFAITRVVNNSQHPNRTELHFLNLTKQNSFATESEFFPKKKLTETEPKYIKKYSTHPYLQAIITLSNLTENLSFALFEPQMNSIHTQSICICMLSIHTKCICMLSIHTQCICMLSIHTQCICMLHTQCIRMLSIHTQCIICMLSIHTQCICMPSIHMQCICMPSSERQMKFTGQHVTGNTCEHDSSIKLLSICHR